MPPNSDPSLSVEKPAPSGGEPVAAERAPGPSGPERTSLAGLPVLDFVRPIAVLAVLAMLLGRMAMPATVGLTVGIGRLVRAVELAGAGVSQVFAIVATVTTLWLMTAVARSQSPYRLRVVAILSGSFVILVVLHATVRRVPDLPSALLGVSAAVLAVSAAWDALRAPFARRCAGALGLVGLGALVRLLGVLLAMRAEGKGSSALVATARTVATASFALEALAVLVAAAALSTRSKTRAAGEPPSPPRLTSPLTILALAVALLATRQALAGSRDDASIADVLLHRAFSALLVRPAPAVPLVVQLFVAALSVVVAILALVVPPGLPALAGALALLLIARSAPEVPLNALSLVISALSVALAARDDRGFWAAVVARDRARDTGLVHGARDGEGQGAAAGQDGAGAGPR
jgi:hypothetical protein